MRKPVKNTVRSEKRITGAVTKYLQIKYQNETVLFYKPKNISLPGWIMGLRLSCYLANLFLPLKRKARIILFSSFLCFVKPDIGPWAQRATRSWCLRSPRCGIALLTSSSRTRGKSWPRSRWRSWTRRSPRPPETRLCHWRPRRGAPPGPAQWGPRCSDPAKRNRTRSWSRNIQKFCLRNYLSFIPSFLGWWLIHLPKGWTPNSCLTHDRWSCSRQSLSWRG